MFFKKYRKQFFIVILVCAAIGGAVFAYQRYAEPPTPHVSKNELNQKAGPPDREEMIKRLLYMSQEGLIPKRMSLRDAMKMVSVLESIGSMAEKFGDDNYLVWARMAWLNSVTSPMLTGLRFEELERVQAPW